MLHVEHSAILSTFIELHVHVPFVIKIYVLSIIEWPFYTGFTVQLFYDIAPIKTIAHATHSCVCNIRLSGRSTIIAIRAW